MWCRLLLAGIPARLRRTSRTCGRWPTLAGLTAAALLASSCGSEERIFSLTNLTITIPQDQPAGSDVRLGLISYPDPVHPGEAVGGTGICRGPGFIGTEFFTRFESVDGKTVTDPVPLRGRPSPPEDLYGGPGAFQGGLRIPDVPNGEYRIVFTCKTDTGLTLTGSRVWAIKVTKGKIRDIGPKD